jgi:hypothetical protein
MFLCHFCSTLAVSYAYDDTVMCETFVPARSSTERQNMFIFLYICLSSLQETEIFP